MDSYHFHFDRMSNLDLHPLSLPVSRLSPEKSSSSTEQYTHHHSKEDSAYSSFSGGSTVPDYPSSFLLDDSLHYTDIKYAKDKYSTTYLYSNLKSMDHLYRSMEAIAHQGPTVPTHSLQPPPPPARVESLVTTKNLENSRAHQSPKEQFAEFCGNRSEPVYGCILSSHFQRDQPNEGFVEKSRSSHSETYRKRSYSAYGRPASGQQCYVSSCHMPQKSTSGNINHKRQFYFVTGVFKSSEPSVTHSAGDSASIEDSSEWSYKAQRRRQSCPDGPSGKLFFQEELKFSNQSDIVEPNNKAVHPSYKLEQTSQSIEDQWVMSKETERHHSSSHPIFYCGPEESSVSKMTTPALIKDDPTSHPKKDEQMTRILRQPQLDVPNEKISKETTPLLYHLTGANRASFTNKLKNKNDCEMGVKVPDCGKDTQKAGKDVQISPSSEHQQSAISLEQTPDFPYVCGTLDDSYKKYYKEKLKDAQSKVLRETSFKRRDLQLSWPNRIKEQTDKRLSVVPASPLSQNMHPSLDNLTPQLHKLQQTEKKNTKDLDQEDIGKGIENEREKPQNIAQPQVPRIGSRKRLTADQKKLSNSEPEKLHQLTDGPAHTACRSLGNEGESLLSDGDHGLAASRKQMFETRGRAFSASNFSKSTLKHLQQKALAAYMERKSGQKVAEPQQPVPQVPSHRNSTAGRLSDSSSRYNSSKKLHRPLSAGRILDSVSSSVKYAQFLNAQPSSHSRESSWREESPVAEKSTSAESLLYQLEQPGLFRARSTSTPHPLQVQKHSDGFSVIHNEDISSGRKRVEGNTVVCHSHTVSEPGDQQARKLALRGKSMEELGVSKISKPEVLSKSSEQLDQLQRKQAVSGKEKRTVSFLAEGRHNEKKTFSCEKPTNNSQAGPENHLSTGSLKLAFPHEDEICMAPYSNGCKNRDDTFTPMLIRSDEADEFNLEAGSEERKASVQHLSNQDVSLSHGITTDRSLWISVPGINETIANIQPSSETTVVEPQNTLPTPCRVREPNPTYPDIQDVKINREQDRIPKKEDGPLVTENKMPEDKGPNHEWVVLVQDVVSADQSLARTFYPITDRKTALMLMEQLLSEDTLLMKEHYRKRQQQKVSNPEETTHSNETHVEDKPLTPSSSLNDGAALSNQKLCDTEMDIMDKKRWLISHLEESLMSLREVRSTLQDEEKENGKRGDAIETLVRESCVPAELERYTQFIGDLERVISLLLCLSARLARVQNALSTVDHNTDTEEKQSLDNRHCLLCKQRDDAKDLKDNLDRRERVVSAFLSKYLTEAQLQEYRRFVQTKASLLIRQKDLDEKQRLGEEQIEALLTSIPQ